MGNKWAVFQLIILVAAVGYTFYTYVPTSWYHPVKGAGECYVLEGFRIRNTFSVYIDPTNVPSGINWAGDVSNAINQYNSHTHFKLFVITSSQTFAQMTVRFGQVQNSQELGVAMIAYDPATGTETSALITLDQTQSWYDNGISLTAYSVEHVLLHEFGHTTGLGHVDSACDDVMTPVTSSGPTRTTLGTGDILGEQTLYG